MLKAYNLVDKIKVTDNENRHYLITLQEAINLHADLTRSISNLQQDDKRKRALSKLTLEERQILGIY